MISRFDCVIVKLSDCLRKGNRCHGSPTFRLALIETGVLILFPAWVTRVGIDILLEPIRVATSRTKARTKNLRTSRTLHIPAYT